MISTGECTEATTPPPGTTPSPCGCSNKCKPVCGTDGKTYRYVASNRYTFWLQVCINPLCIHYSTYCCSTQYHKYCRNECQLRCACKTNPDLDVWYKGKCRQQTTTPAVETTYPTLCDCPTFYRPVCGQDGNTYNNTCWLGCANVAMKYKGRCRNRPTTTTETPPTVCTCTDRYNPVCSADGITYANECQLNCEGDTLVYRGEFRTLTTNQAIRSLFIPLAQS